jgi:hypothetical protein
MDSNKKKWEEYKKGLRERVRAEASKRPKRTLCPECRAEVTWHPSGMGQLYECSCGWSYYHREARRTEQVYHSASPDGYRPEGYYDREVTVDLSRGTPPIRE